MPLMNGSWAITGKLLQEQCGMELRLPFGSRNDTNKWIADGDSVRVR